MDPLQIISNRIAYLNSIVPKDSAENLNNETVVDAITSANSLINSVISGREKIADATKRANEVERILDPNYVLENKQFNMKEIYLNTVVNGVANSFEMLQKIKHLEPVLGAEYFGDIPNVTDKLKTLIQTAREQKERNEMIEESLISSIQRYSEIQTEIHQKLKEMSDYLDQYDETLEVKKKIESDAPQ